LYQLFFISFLAHLDQIFFSETRWSNYNQTFIFSAFAHNYLGEDIPFVIFIFFKLLF